jgi:hypothetical protein
MIVNPPLPHAHHPHKGEKLAFALVFVPSYLLLLLVGAIGFVLGLPLKSWLPGAENTTNIFSAVSAGIYTFMAHTF